MTHSEIVELQGENSLEAVVVADNRTRRADASCRPRPLFVFIGASPHTEWLDGCVAMDEDGFLLTGRDAQRRGPRRLRDGDAPLLPRDQPARASSPSATCARARSSGSPPAPARARWRSSSSTSASPRAERRATALRSASSRSMIAPSASLTPSAGKRSRSAPRRRRRARFRPPASRASGSRRTPRTWPRSGRRRRPVASATSNQVFISVEMGHRVPPSVRSWEHTFASPADGKVGRCASKADPLRSILIRPDSSVGRALPW